MDIEKDFFRIEILGRGESPEDTPKSEGFSFEIPHILDDKDFFDDKGFPNKTGSLIVTKFLIEALVGNIYTVDKAGHYDKKEHIQDAIELLQSLFNSNWKVHAMFGSAEDWFDKPKTE